MRKSVPPIAAVLLALTCAVPAQAEKWTWYPVRGGAVAIDEESRKTDAAEGRVGAHTVIFYDQARKIDNESFNFVAERLEFECRGDRHRWSQSAVLDEKGYVVRARPDGDWTAIGTELGSAALFKRMLCLSETPPNGREAADMDTLLAALAGTAAKTPRVDLGALAFSAPKAAAAPPPPAPKAALPPVPTPKVEAPPPPAPKVEAPAPKASPAPAAPAAPVVVAAAPTPKPPAEPKAASPNVSQTPYATAPRCIDFKRQPNLTYLAVNDCAYRVNYAWCVAGGADPKVECLSPLIARVSSAVPPKAQASSAYLGGVGRIHVFACRAPGTPIVRGEDGRYDYECLGPAPAAAPPLIKAPAPKAEPKAPPATPAGPQLRPKIQ